MKSICENLAMLVGVTTSSHFDFATVGLSLSDDGREMTKLFIKFRSSSLGTNQNQWIV